MAVDSSVNHVVSILQKILQKAPKPVNLQAMKMYHYVYIIKATCKVLPIRYHPLDQDGLLQKLCSTRIQQTMHFHIISWFSSGTRL